MKKKLKVIRNFLYRLFLIGFIINTVSALSFISIHGQGLEEAAKMLNVTPAYLIELALTSLNTIKLVLFYIVLLPAIALHWTIARDKNLD